MAYATIDDLISVDPTIKDYGVLDWTAELTQAEDEVNRLLVVRWWPTYKKQGRIDIRYSQLQVLMKPELLDPTQWTKATVYYALGYLIAPKLTKFEPESDRFQEMMKYWAGRFEHEFDLCLREGVRYDANEDSTFSDNEKIPDVYLRLRR